ncbi:MAG: hypothetical protein RH859_09415 [Longimicrobiales bacterium]
MDAYDGRAILFVDGTQSMAGFTEGEAFREFDIVLDAVATGLGLTQVVMFGVTEAPPPAGGLFRIRPAGRGLHDENAYIGLNNPDYCLFDLARTSSDPRPILYLTDGVQSARSLGTPGPSVAVLQELIRTGHTVSVMAFRGGFAGRAWSEQASAWIPGVSVPDRPFYLIWVTRDQADSDFLFSMLSRASLGHVAFARFGGASPSCRLFPLIDRQSEQEDPLWILLPPSVARRIDSEHLPVAEWRCALPPSTALEFVAASVASTFRAWEPGSEGFSPPTEAPVGTEFSSDSIHAEGTSSSVVVKGTVGTLTSSRYAYIALGLTATPGPLREDLRSLSTNSDVSPDEVSRTYRFAWLLDHLIQADFAREVPREQIGLTIQYR